MILALDRFLPVAASATLLVLPGAAAVSTGAVRTPMIQPQQSGRVEAEMLVAVQGPRPTIALPPLASGDDSRFTAADMWVLDAVDRAVSYDDMDYTGLFDYDDD